MPLTHSYEPTARLDEPFHENEPGLLRAGGGYPAMTTGADDSRRATAGRVPAACLCALTLVLAAAGGLASAAPPARGPQYLKSNVPNAPFSAAVRVDNILYLSGQIGIGVDGNLPEDFTDQVRQTMSNVQATLRQGGLTLEDVFKCTVMLADMSRWEDFNKIYVSYFKPERLPARSALGANGLARGALVELECAAYASGSH